MDATHLRVGVLGCGNVGGALVRLLVVDRERIAARTGTRLEVGAVAVRSLARDRDVPVPEGRLTTDAAAVVVDPEIDIVVELMGGIEPARTLILAALKAGKPVVTANKELIANCGAELWEAAANAGVDLLFEAAVAGGIPLIRPLRESLAGEHIRRVMGIVNGTTNFILSKMSDGGASYHDALAEAQSLGYAERDPTADVEGFDAAAKAAIIANVAFGARVVAGDVYREGISGITEIDIAVARRLGYVIKLLAIVEQPDSDVGPVGVRVHPTMIPATHPLAAVRDSYNAVFVEGDAVGDLMLHGRGAGGMPTASAVLGDLLDACHNLGIGAAGRSVALREVPLRPIDDVRSAYYLNLVVADRPGVLRAVAEVFANHSVSVRSMEQEGAESEASGADLGARLVFITHRAVERDVQACLSDLHHLDVVREIGSLIRVIGAA
ncbi:MAG: homoserine dehydrogenase [Acidimicrobiaceae bacterium]|nr:homoserine dehydrogenase [Acidimicrobiaceae bacterium]